MAIPADHRHLSEVLDIVREILNSLIFGNGERERERTLRKGKSAYHLQYVTNAFDILRCISGKVENPYAYRFKAEVDFCQGVNHCYWPLRLTIVGW